MGGELKATFCLVKDGEAILSQHQGDLENAATFDDYRTHLALYASCSTTRRSRSSSISIRNICRPSSRATSRATASLIEVQHHHAHVAACLAENAVRSTPAGARHRARRLGWGDDGTIWGGEFLLADYRSTSGSAASSRSRCPAARRPRASRGAISMPI